MNMLFHAHSGLRYLVLLAAVLAIGALVYGLATGRPLRATRALTAAFTGLLDLQVLLGIAMVIGGVMYDALTGHLVMMVLAVVAAHGASIMANRAATEHKERVIRLVGILLALCLIAGGIMAIGRGVLGTGAPHVS